MERSCSKHRQRCQRSDSRCHHQQKGHNCRRNSDSMTRNYYPGGVDHRRSSMHRRQPVAYEESRNRKPNNHYHNHNHNCHYKHYYDNLHHYGHDTSGGETSSYTSTTSSDSSSYERMRRYDGGGEHCRKRHRRRSPPPKTGRSSRRSSSDSNFTPMNYGTPGCVGCQQQQQWAQGYAPPVAGGQAPPPTQGGWKQIPAQPYGQPAPGGQAPPQQQPQSKPPPPELEELRKSVFKGIKEFSKSLRNQQWLGDIDYLRSSRNVKHGHKGDTLEKHQQESKRRDWVPIY